MSKPTPGPWYADKNGNIWRRPIADLYENGGSVAGDKPLAMATKGWYGKNEQGYPIEANASLIAAAPETAAERDKLKEINAQLLEALKSVVSRWAGCPNDQTPREVKDARTIIAKCE